MCSKIFIKYDLKLESASHLIIPKLILMLTLLSIVDFIHERRLYIIRTVHLQT